MMTDDGGFRGVSQMMTLDDLGGGTVGCEALLLLRSNFYEKSCDFLRLFSQNVLYLPCFLSDFQKLGFKLKLQISAFQKYQSFEIL